MTEPKFTKGPWQAIEINWERSLVVDEDAARIALVYIRDEDDEETQDKFEAIKNADANLIAAAPDMYEALECACDKYCIGYAGDSIVKCEDCIIGNALRKAQGESE